MEYRFYALLNQRIPKSLEAGLKQEADESDEILADVIRDCLYRGLTDRQRLRRKLAKQETPLQLVNSQ
ncbi:MAG: hypothetical protein LH702_22940 [Phormidesmis sp. CAN_BIN44]|nr:hypothetical protein [Phormidesmis sp. CAN_BIN44]